jgi:hypothetical protein
MMITHRNLSIAKAIWRDFLALCERLVGSAGMMPFWVVVGIVIGGAIRAGHYALSAFICATSVAAAGYFVARIGRSNVRHAISVSFFLLFFGGFGFAIGVLSR